ncbi:MAG: T9SS type A sorting domain-containing protein [Flavobacteriia bacterium]|nr:T9SS type A sorting domain-containing protein [Flavobacteriia bacterium]
MKKHLLFFTSMFFALTLFAQIPSPALIGYWQNWQDPLSPYIQLDQIDSRYNVVEVSFAEPLGGTDYNMQFYPDQVSQSTLITQIQTLQNQGKKVLISIGGASAPISLSDNNEKSIFISSVRTIINTYGFDGIDIDFEGNSMLVTGGTISAPTDIEIQNIIDAIQQIENNFFTDNGTEMLLTFAPETVSVQGGMSNYSGQWGSYLPVIEALSNSIDVLQVQLYNTGDMYGIDGGDYFSGTADFIVAMTEAVIQGFTAVNGAGTFSGLPANKVAVGLPACSGASDGSVDFNTLKAAIDYLRGNGPKPGNYTLIQNGGYPNLLGLMTWSINWDAIGSCAPSYQFANSFETIFGIAGLENFENKPFIISPNPSNGMFQIFSTTNIENTNIIHVFNELGELVYQKNCCNSIENLDLSHLSKGMYTINFQNIYQKIIIL